MQTTATQLIRQILSARYEIDQNYPAWARRTDPIVRRQLGVYWRVMTPQFEPILTWYFVQCGIVLLTAPLPFLFTIILPLVIVSVGVLFPALYYYGMVLYGLATDSSRSMVNEVENSTLTLLLMTPKPRLQILLSKIAGVLWKQSEGITILISIVALTQLPTLILMYLNLYLPQEFGIMPQLLVIASLGASIFRIPLETFMVVAIGIYVGKVTPGRSAAAMSTLVLVIFYFLLVNMPRMIALTVIARLVVEIILPLIAPLIVIGLMIGLTLRELDHD
ncbi:MAG: hypothetical protein MUF87_02310 [Anaerolineae bacterium]|jgi:hypothetical protein|nr:hypothetical protein [Anaerolineae bacterium]